MKRQQAAKIPGLSELAIEMQKTVRERDEWFDLLALFEAMAGLLYDYTSGYPYLVSRLCKLIDEKVCAAEIPGDKKSVWTKDCFLESVRMLLSENNTLFESLIGKFETEIRALYDNMAANMNEEQKQVFIERYGSMEAFEEHYLKSAASEQAQKNFAKVVECYGSKEAVLGAATNPVDSNVMNSYQKRIEAVQQKIAGKMGTDVNSFEVRELIGEYDFVAKQLYQMDDVKKLMLDMAKLYKSNQKIQEGIDSVSGAGAALYIGEAIEAFYNR